MKIIGSIFILVLTSLFFFPFNTSLLPSVNTKMALAGVGLLLFAYNAARRSNAEADPAFLKVSLWAGLVSAAGLFSALANDSGDYSYASYIVTAWVWMGGAYTVVKSVEAVFGKATLRLLTNFLVAVCVVQCFLSQIIDSNQAFARWVDGFMVSTGFMGKVEDRIYGIGCALDVAGMKFCTVLALLAHFAINPSGRINKYVEISLYLAALFIIGVLGNMISRTTSIGVAIAIAYWIGYSLYNRNNAADESQAKSLWTVFAAAVVVFVPVVAILYHTDAGFHTNLRFAFEGFFSLAEKGEWEVSSNNMLMGMWVWPDNAVTWIMGDGYFNSPESNPYYIGPIFEDYYMGTDIGYCRFVFYFGLVGLALFCAYFVVCAQQCSNNLPEYRQLFWIILIINFICWNKVSSDIFPIYALLLMLGRQHEENYAPSAV